MAFCKTPPFLEGAQLSQLEIEKLTCTEVSHLDTDGDEIMIQINKMYNDFLDNFTMTNSSSNVSILSILNENCSINKLHHLSI
jgi:hypothetical protein